MEHVPTGVERAVIGTNNRLIMSRSATNCGRWVKAKDSAGFEVIMGMKGSQRVTRISSFHVWHVQAGLTGLAAVESPVPIAHRSVPGSIKRGDIGTTDDHFS